MLRTLIIIVGTIVGFSIATFGLLSWQAMGFKLGSKYSLHPDGLGQIVVIVIGLALAAYSITEYRIAQSKKN